MVLALVDTTKDLLTVIAVGGAFIVAALGIVGGVVSGMYSTRSREKTKREIAAYIAEGSMTPEQGERLLQADRPVWEKGSDFWRGCKKT